MIWDAKNHSPPRTKLAMTTTIAKGQRNPANHGVGSAAQNSAFVWGHRPFNVNPSAIGITRTQIATATGPIIGKDTSSSSTEISLIIGGKK
jgi:hypothetical protein